MHQSGFKWNQLPYPNVTVCCASFNYVMALDGRGHICFDCGKEYPNCDGIRLATKEEVDASMAAGYLELARSYMGAKHKHDSYNLEKEIERLKREVHRSQP